MLNNCRNLVRKFKINETAVKVKYLYKSGANYNSILDKTDFIDQAEEYEPDFVLVILAGNSIDCDTSNQKIFDNIKEFYLVLKSRLPNSIIISALSELRFYQENNKWNCPTIERFKKRRHSVNKYLNRQKSKDYILNISGPGRLDNKEYYKSDGVHLNDEGLLLYFDLIRSTIRYIMIKTQN